MAQYNLLSPKLATEPNLVKFHTEESASHFRPDKEGARAILESLNHRSNTEYKSIGFSAALEPNKNYRNRVSFDTVDIQNPDDDVTLDFSDDDMYDWYLPSRLLIETDIRGRGRDRELSPMRSPGVSPGASPTRMLSPTRGMDISRLFQNQLKYPTTPIITRRSCTLTREHKQFDDLYTGKLLECPVLPGRVILVYISGRQHTWVAMDWVLRGFVEHGDTVIIVSAVPQNPNANASRYRPRVRIKDTTPQKVTKAAANVMKYAMRVVDPCAIVRVTVEVCEGPTKDVLKDMYRLYEPNIVCTALKVNTRNSAPLKLWLLLRLSDRLVKNFPLPVVVVPASNMGQFEREVKEDIDGYMSSSTLGRSELAILEEESEIMRNLRETMDNMTTHKHEKEKRATTKEGISEATRQIIEEGKAGETAEGKAEGIEGVVGGTNAGANVDAEQKDVDSEVSGVKTEGNDANNSANIESHRTAMCSRIDYPFENDADHSDTLLEHSVSSDAESYDSLEEIADLYHHYRLHLHRELHRLTAKPRDEEYFANFLRAISDRSLLFCEDLRSTDPDFRGDGAKLARAITGSTSFGAVPYKTKSLLIPEPERPAPVPVPGAISVSELKRNLRLNAMRSNEDVQAPSILVKPPSEETTPISSPKPSVLRFSETEKPTRRRQSTAPLKKYFSHEDHSNGHMKLTPSTSHPDIRTVMLTESDPKKKKKKRFWKLF